MEQRRGGIVLIAVVVLGIFVTSNLRPREVAGSAVAQPVPGPPAVGDCVNSPFVPERPETIAPGGVLQTRLPVLDIGPCTGSRYGEVVTVNDRRERIDSGAYGYDADMSECWEATRTWGGQPPFRLEAGADLSWGPVYVVSAELAGPDDLQRATQQSWLACVAHPIVFGDSDLAQPTPYQGSLRDSYATGRHRDLTGVCLSGPDEWVSCTDTHSGQQIAYGVSGSKAQPRAEVLRSCEQQIGVLTRMEDWTADGALTARLEVLEPDGDPLVDPVPPGSNLGCLVEATGARQLAGGLVGLGSDPIPWG